MDFFSIENQEKLNSLLLPILALIGMAFAVCVDPYVRKSKKRIMLTIDVIVLTLIAENTASNMMMAAWDPSWVKLKTAMSVYCYIMRPVVITLFVYIVWDDPRRRWFWIPVGVNAGMYLTALFRPWMFYTTPDGLFNRGPLGHTAYWISVIMLVALLAVTLIQFRQVRGMERLIPIANALVAALGALMDSNTKTNGTITFTELAMVFCCVFFYIWLHLQFVRDHEQALVSEQRIQIMMSQIQPHFLYNTLTTIQALCLQNPKKAAAITERFATYLRQNIDSLNDSSLIPFRKELDHTLVYAQIEMERFPGIHLDYEIEDEDFRLPALTIQPLVENAIRHGVRGMTRGQVDIITNLLPGCHEIVIRDNGKGFSVKEAPRTEGSHIGLQNVRERLERLCGGTMTIDSEIGRGTCVTIRIPRGKENL